MATGTTGIKLVQAGPRGGWRFTPPAPRLITVPNPVPGAEWTWKAPADRLLRLSVVRCKLVTSATAGTREVLLVVKAATGTVLWTLYAGEKVALSTTVNVTWLRQGPATHATAANVDQSLPDVTLPPNCTVSVVTAALSATDQYSTVTILAELI